MMSESHDDAIAIVGMSCRVPGAATLETLWQNLRDGRESIERWSAGDPIDDEVDPALLADPRFVRARATLPGIEEYDAHFFEDSPAEAALLDPQHRVFLECCWEALEVSGHVVPDPRRLVGVFGGTALSSYLLLHVAPQARRRGIDPLLVNLGNGESFLATRVSYKLDLRGPSHSVASACSTSLVAVHLAAQSLLNHECDVALAGGVSINLTQRHGYLHVEGSVLAKDGACRPFDASAGGIVFGSGCGVVALRRLADAIADGDHIHAVILGSAINNDGAARSGYTAPSVDGQAEVIREALANASTDPSEIDYVEAHGTGTALGDPIELRALRKALGPAQHRASCAVGSLKGNVGHLDAAAGVLGLIKVALMMEHAMFVPSVGCAHPSPLIEWTKDGFHVQQRLQPWDGGRPRRAGVSSFGMGGTNAHVIVGEPPPRADPAQPRPQTSLLVLSAKTSGALQRQGEQLADWLERHPERSLTDVEFTLAKRRRFEFRRCVVAATREDAVTQLRTATDARARTPSRPAVVWMFPGQGSQFVGMAASLLVEDEIFRRTFERSAEVLSAKLGLDLRALLTDAASDPEPLRATAIAQPALFAIEHAIAESLKARGVLPDALIGHSLGELAAACVAGVFTFEDALDLVVARGRLMQAQVPGAMLSIWTPRAEVAAWLSPSLELAAVNAPSLCVVAGPTAEIEVLEARLTEAGIRQRRLHTSHAFHSRSMVGAAEAFVEEVSRYARRPPTIPIASNLDGSLLDPDVVTSPEYWGRLIVRPVAFAAGVETLSARWNEIVWIELGPGRALSTFVRATHRTATAIEIQPSGHGAPGEWPSALGKMWQHGLDPSWSTGGDHCNLPTYPFERSRHWIERSDDSRPNVVRHPATPARASASPPSLEREVAAIWSDVLGIEEIGMDDDFFEMGGHSLLATTLIGRLREHFGIDVPLQRLFEAPTVRMTAGIIGESRALETPTRSSVSQRFLQELARLSQSTISIAS